jgi:hypothetical protein
VWADARLQALAREFVPAADEVWRLQRGNDEESQFFQRTVNGGELISDSGTRQGIWVMAAGGVLLARINSTNADAVLAMMERGLAAWKELPDGQKHLPADVALAPRHRWEHSYPEGGLVLERYARDLPADGDPQALRSRRWNKDFVWFSRSEARSWLPPEPEVGAQHVLPAALAQRLARLHLVDNVRGQTLPYAPQEIRKAEIVCSVTARTDALVELELRGTTQAKAGGPWLLGKNLWTPKKTHDHGIETRLLGHASFDLERGAFTSFELLALGWRSGQTVMNGRSRDPAPGPIGFHLTLAAATPRIAPTFVLLYDVDWVELPDDPRQLRTE